jgi:hypothetical protein
MPSRTAATTARPSGRRKEWFVPATWPSYAAWWVAEGHIPPWEEAIARIEHLHAHGPTPFAFDFRQPFDAAGQPVKLDRGRVREAIPSVR